MRLSKSDIIAKQVRKLMERKKTIIELRCRLSEIRMHIICVGGPLNDNKLKYSKEQLAVFTHILEEAEG